MKVGVISDTHIPVSSKKLPRKIHDYFKDCDLIIHAGDVTDVSVIDELGRIAETKAVRGNMDSEELKRRLPEKIVLDIAGKKIGVIHGKGPAFGVRRMVEKAFFKKPDVIIFGHSHAPFNEKIDGTLFFNPGSATDTAFAQYRSFGLIEIDGDNIRGKIIKIDDK